MKAAPAFFMLLAGAAALATSPAGAQETPRASEYAEVLKLPDWVGIWYPDWSQLFSGRAAQTPKLTPAAQAAYDKYLAETKANGPDQYAQAHCLPPGLPGMMQQPYPIEVLYSPGRVTIFAEAYSQVRRIYTDGRKNPADPDLFYNGNSVGHWEGDTLVIETVGLSPETFLAPGIKHSDKVRVDEKLYLSKPGTLMDEMTFTDPEVLTEPFVARVAYKLDNSFPIREYVCGENNHLITGDAGAGANIDLGLDPNDTPLEDDPFGTEEGDDAGQ